MVDTTKSGEAGTDEREKRQIVLNDKKPPDKESSTEINRLCSNSAFSPPQNFLTFFCNAVARFLYFFISFLKKDVLSQISSLFRTAALGGFFPSNRLEALRKKGGGEI